MGKSYSEKVKNRSSRSNRKRERQSSKKIEEKPPFPWMPIVVIGVIIILIISGVYLYTNEPEDGSGSEITTNNGNSNGSNNEGPVDNGPGSITLQTTTGGDLTLDQYKGKVIVLDMFATWCSPCKTQMVELEKVESRFSPSEIVILSVGVDLSESMGLITEFKADEGAEWPFAKSNNQFNSEFPASSIPTLYILDKDGNISQTRVGVTSADVLESDIRAIL